MVKSIYLIVFTLLVQIAFLNAMDEGTDQPLSILNSVVKEHKEHKEHYEPRKLITDNKDEFEVVSQDACNIVYAPGPKGLIN